MIVTEKDRKAVLLNQVSQPANFDPDKLYRYNYHQARQEAEESGELVPLLVYRYIPYSIIKSFTLAWDPLWKFRGFSRKVTPINRTRIRRTRSVLDPRIWYDDRRTVTVTDGISLIDHCKPTHARSELYSPWTYALPVTPAPVETTKDTTSRTRPIGSAYGEYERTSYKTYSPARQVNSSSYTRTDLFHDAVCPGTHDSTWSSTVYTGGVRGDSAILASSDVAALLSSEKAYLGNLMAHKVTGMLPKVMPTNRQYTLFRNIAELRDIPHSVKSLREALSDVKSFYSSLSKGERKIFTDLTNNVRNIPGEFVSYQFGWRQLFSDIQGLIASPERVARQVNRLIARQGKASTYRLEQKYALDGLTAPSFSYWTTDREQTPTTSTEVERSVKLRMCVNATFDFPPVALPFWQNNLFLHKMGVVPTPIDLYNLVPWTWLVDWFTGLGNYLECIQVVNTDPSIINWGFLTGTLSGKLVTTRNWKTTDTNSYQEYPGPTVTTTTVSSHTHESVCEYEVTIRKDLVSAYGMKSTLSPSNLSVTAKAILSAILLGFSGATKKSTIPGTS